MDEHVIDLQSPIKVANCKCGFGAVLNLEDIGHGLNNPKKNRLYSCKSCGKWYKKHNSLDYLVVPVRPWDFELKQSIREHNNKMLTLVPGNNEDDA